MGIAMTTGTVVRIGVMIVLFLGGLAGFAAIWETHFGGNSAAVQVVRQKIESVEKHDQDQDVQLRNHELTLDKHGRSLDAHEFSIETAQKDLHAQELRITSLEGDIARHLENIHKLETSTGALGKEITSLKDELSTFQADLDGERKAHQALKDAFENYKTNVETRVKRLERMLKLDNPE